MLRVLFLATLVSLLLVIGVTGQSTSSLSGTVTDPTGAVIPAATITVVNSANNSQRETTSDHSGRYGFSQLAPGDYSLRAKAQGFADVVLEKIELLVNTPASVTIAFTKVGTVSETVAVAADAVQVNTTDASIGNAIGTQPITQLPFEARNVVGLLSLQPGVVYLGEPDPGATNDYRSGAVNGGKSDQGNVTLDGVDVNDQQNRSAFTSVLRVTLDSVQEFRTITTNAGADFGRTSGAQVSLVTKSGTNVVHGSLYEYVRNTATNANTFFNNIAGLPREKLDRNVFGVALGGPIKKNRLFLFLNYEGRKDDSERSVLRTVPNDTLRQGIFTYSKKTGGTGQYTPAQIKDIIDPLHIGPDAAVLALYQSYPHPNTDKAGDGLNTSGFRFNAAAPLNWNTYIARFDYQVDQAGKHQIFWRGNLQNDNYVPFTGLGQFPGDPESVRRLENSKGLAVGYTALLSNALVSTFHYGLTRQSFTTTGNQKAPAAYFRDISNRFPLTQELDETIPLNQFSEDVSWNKGAHNVTFGAVARIIRNRRLDFSNSFSSAYGNSSWLLGSGGNLVGADARSTTAYRRQMSNLLGLLTQLTGQYNYDKQGNLLPQGTGIRRNFASEEYEMYLQDTWRVTRGLTVTAGMRLSLFPAIREQNGFQTSPNVPLGDWFNIRGGLAAQGKSQALAPQISYNLAGGPGTRPLYPFQKDWAPRLAIAYSPQGNSGLSKFLFGGPGNTAIRAGFGMFYDLFGEGLIRSFDSTSLGFTTSLQNPASATATGSPRFTGFFNVPLAALPAAPKGGFPQVQPDIFQITNGIDDKLKAPYSMNIDFSIQRQLGHGFLVQGAYVGRLSRRSIIRDDLAMPTNLKDPKSNMTYFEAARMLTAMINAGVDTSKVGKIPFFENLWPNAAGGGQTATQNIYDLYANQGGDYTTGLYELDVPGGGFCCSTLGPYAMFNAQYSTLSALRSRGGGNYHAFQWTVRKRYSSGIQFDFNYTFAKSIDLGSTRETALGNFSGTLINAWFPGLNKGVSDYDVQHTFSAFWVAELPFGRGKKYLGHANGFTNALAGGWALSGVFRNTSGLPTGVVAGGVWPTNWETGSYAIQDGLVPASHTTKNAPAVGGAAGPNLFTDPNVALKGYNLPLAGDVGQRNGIRGDGYFGIDMGVSKRFQLFRLRDQPHTLQLRVEAFNITNTVRFDPQSASLNIISPTNFGKYTDVLTRPRVFQFGARYEF